MSFTISGFEEPASLSTEEERISNLGREVYTEDDIAAIKTIHTALENLALWFKFIYYQQSTSIASYTFTVKSIANSLHNSTNNNIVR